MPLNLIHGPPNSGRAGIVRRRFTEELARSPVLVLPTLDDVFAFERELCHEEGALLGGWCRPSTPVRAGGGRDGRGLPRRGSAATSASGS